jgi:hypothetical protein
LSGYVLLQPTTKKEVELQVVEVPSIINLQRPFTVIYDPIYIINQKIAP